MSKVAFIGLGAMGYPLAGHLAKRFETWVYNRTPAKAEAHAAEFGSHAVSLRETAQADLIFTCVPVSRDVDELARRLLPDLRPNTLWVDHTSGEPTLARETAALLATRGVTYLDAPLSGGVIGAQNAKATVMVGGDPAAFEQAKGVMETYAAKIVHVGPLGSGHAVKAVNNALLAVNLWALSEGMVALVKEGVNPRLALEVINASSGRSNVSENLFGQRVVSRSFPNTFALGLLAKDLGIANQVFQEAGTPAPLLRQLREFFEVAKREIGSTEVDHTAVARLLEKWAGLEIQ
ncbi:NAD(P)-dependent oxidoreductase [Meiothermus granaticius]|uniref:2-(Hydroxymethyl)glutarate dehydrogenase n=1 Tax=Meiothermus granaticius NBRC 107808 TaxID=1227551 RepID=A0A399FB79_9DEIN|nr:NAD(P)-dependent oxidoreductase [Meiothermus granaticius]RIH92152.1 2-(hydroxymethyl)glutarate dehydrogenase [Meiothermus granaticius NBRC 107808]GEM86555.1 3-hydroxyisobutyrate dehydrogenase [Meiothermus granaticius NBRC 107808]